MPQTTTHEEKRIVAVGATALIILMNDRVALPGFNSTVTVKANLFTPL